MLENNNLKKTVLPPQLFFCWYGYVSVQFVNAITFFSFLLNTYLDYRPIVPFCFHAFPI